MSNEVTIISVDDLKENTSISKNIGALFLEPYIGVAEDMHVYDVLGLALKSEILNQITGGTLTGNNYTLVEVYIKPLACYATWLEASPFIAYKTTAKGITIQTSDTSQPITKDDLEFYRQAIRDKVSFYRNRLIDQLKNNSTLYPAYRSSDNSGSDLPYTSPDFSNGIYLGNSN